MLVVVPAMTMMVMILTARSVQLFRKKTSSLTHRMMMHLAIAISIILAITALFASEHIKMVNPFVGQTMTLVIIPITAIAFWNGFWNIVDVLSVGKIMS